jgi:sigma-E factor negative regulatory protein RseB
MNRLGLVLCLALSALGGFGVAEADVKDDPRAWLDRMSTALSQMDYQGTFVYIQGNHVETMRITHVAGETGVRERLVSVSGAPRELIRDTDGVRWIRADDQSVMADPAFNRPFFKRLPEELYDAGNPAYSLELGKTGRIAGHPARNLKVLPRDEFRYGYSLWLEAHSGLLLKWELIGQNNKSLAKLMFTNLLLGSEVDHRELKPAAGHAGFRVVESALPEAKGGLGREPAWQPANLPQGFRLTAHRMSAPEGGGKYEHLVYSDGLVAVSVYVENAGEDADHHAGLKRHGTTHAYRLVRDDMRFTVVGEVPSATVKRIAQSMERVGR